MNKKLYLKNTSILKYCFPVFSKSFDANTTLGTQGTASIGISNTPFIFTASFESPLTSSITSFVTALTASLNVVSVTGAFPLGGPIEYKFNLTVLSSCAPCNVSNWSAIFTGTGVHQIVFPFTWGIDKSDEFCRPEKVMLGIYAHKVSGSSAVLTIATDDANSFININPWFD